ncbi:hypothetical protein AgCh_005223 [Apium graveolens]
MNEIDKNPTELLAMLKTAETNVQKASPAPMLIVNKGKSKGKRKCKGKRKIGSKSNANLKPDLTKALKPKGGVPKELQGSRTLAKGEVDLRVGNGEKVPSLALDLTLQDKSIPNWKSALILKTKLKISELKLSELKVQKIFIRR